MTADGFEWLRYYLKTPSVGIDFNNEVKKADSLYVWSLSRGFAELIISLIKTLLLKQLIQIHFFLK